MMNFKIKGHIWSRNRARLLGRLGAILLAACGVSSARAESLLFDLENQIAAPKSKDEGRLTFLSLSRNGFTMEITRPGSAFDLAPQSKDSDYRKPASWGEISLSSFYDPDSTTPLNINFSAPVSSFSLCMGDFAEDTDSLELEAFSLPNGQGQSLGRTTRTLKSQDDQFSFEELAIRAAGIRSVRIVAGSSLYPHSMFYDRFRVDTSSAPSGE